jgi:leader peptidase (prepilin peptidase)/N-methyltransferase
MKQALKRKVVWALIGLALLSCSIEFRGSPALALAYGVLLAGLIVATWIDFKHFIIPDELSLGGILVGFLCSSLLPSLHGQRLFLPGMLQSLLGLGVGVGVMYLVLRAGKLAFGRQRLALPGDTMIVFTDTALLLPEKEISYDELFHRKSDAIMLRARMVELGGRSYQDVPIRLTPASLQVGDDEFHPEAVSRMEALTAEIVSPREAMGLGDVKLMAAIGAFLGWQAVAFSLLISSMIGSVVGVSLIAAGRREWSSRLPYGPYIALAAAIWIFGGRQLLKAVFGP